MSQIGTEKGTRLSLAERRAIRADLVRVARTSGSRSYRFAYDGDQLYEFRAWPSGRCVRSRVTMAGLAIEPQRRLVAGISARVAALAGGSLLVAADVLSRLV